MGTCGDIGEDGILRLVRKILGDAPTPRAESARVQLGIGDDCAALALRSERPWLLTTDSLVEDVHFRKHEARPADLGYKLLAVNLSDLASKGAQPAAALLSLSLPAALEVSWLESLLAGLAELAKQEGIPIVGGNTTASPGPLVLGLNVVGEAPAAPLKRRAAAEPGDAIYVSGTLGDARAGLRALAEKRSPTESPWRELIARHYRPPLRLREGAWLALRPEVHAMMDLSDGLARDLVRLLESSAMSACVDVQQLPLSPTLQAAAALADFNPHEEAFVGGEDYELLWTIDGKFSAAFERDFVQEFGRQPHRIGEVLPAAAHRLYDGNKKPLDLQPWRSRGYEHFICR